MCPEGTVTALVVLLMFDLPLGPAQLVLSMEVSFVEGLFNIIKYQNLTRKVSFVARYLLFKDD